MAEKFSIYAAPLTQHGVYRHCEDKPMYRRDFATFDAMLAFWSSKIVPHTRLESGAEFELAMVVTPTNGRWGFHDQPRYSNSPILSKRDLV